MSIDKSAAAERPDVVGVYTHDDLAGDFAAPMPMIWAPAGVEIKTPEHWPLAKDAVKHVGDPVAIVIGTDRYSVNDAIEDVIVEYESLPPVVDPEAALQDGLAARLGPVRHEQDTRMGNRGRRSRCRLCERRQGHQAARGQPPHRGSADRDARRAWPSRAAST